LARTWADVLSVPREASLGQRKPVWQGQERDSHFGRDWVLLQVLRHVQDETPGSAADHRCITVVKDGLLSV
jgi:hypothetical protein